MTDGVDTAVDAVEAAGRRAMGNAPPRDADPVHELGK
jgi:hypothetical protein